MNKDYIIIYVDYKDASNSRTGVYEARDAFAGAKNFLDNETGRNTEYFTDMTSIHSALQQSNCRLSMYDLSKISQV